MTSGFLALLNLDYAFYSSSSLGVWHYECPNIFTLAEAQRVEDNETGV